MIKTALCKDDSGGKKGTGGSGVRQRLNAESGGYGSG